MIPELSVLSPSPVLLVLDLHFSLTLCNGEYHLSFRKVVLRDGRHLVGVMRSYDQFSNIVLEDTHERHFVGGELGEKHAFFEETPPA